MDKKVKVASPLRDPDNKKTLMQSAYILFALGIICALIGIGFNSSLSHIGIESIFMMAVMLTMLGIIFYTNVKMDIEDPKAIHLENPKTLFNTTVGFNVSAIGIIVIVAFLYGVFW